MFKIFDYLKNILFMLLFIQIAPALFSQIKKQWRYSIEQHNQIGYILIDQTIIQTSIYQQNLADFFKNPSIKAILIKIEAQDGLPGSCQALAHDIESLKKEFPKPIIAYI